MCIFCKIIKGEIPCKKIYEDEKNLSFLDIYPRSIGHALVIPKQHCVTLDELTVADVASFAMAVQTVAKLLKNKLNAPAFNIVSNNGVESGQEVAHLHFHILPRFANDGIHVHFPPVSNDAKHRLEEIYQDIVEK